MAYCSKCGAYIPDGQIICLACGYDPTAEQKAAEAAEKKRPDGNAAYEYVRNTNSEMRRRLDEQRKRAQEQNRRWAEEEKVRREEQVRREAARKAQQERDRQWAQEEYERRQSEQRSRTIYSDDSDYRSSSEATGTGEGNKALAALSYLSVLFALPYIFTPQDQYAKFHARQGLKLFILGIFVDLFGGLTGLGWILEVLRLYLIFKGMSNALNGRREKLPLIGDIGE